MQNNAMRCRLKLMGLGPQDRQMAHAYCDELGLGHESRGEDPNRFLYITRPPSEEDDDDAAAQSEQQNAVMAPSASFQCVQGAYGVGFGRVMCLISS